jgi:L-ascorbate metabolism protein UlaG (beta-lactamase superfamily)
MGNAVDSATGMAGFLINSRGTTIMVDPLLEGFDMPITIDMPIAPEDVPKVDAILVTHSDNDHYMAGTRPRDRGRGGHRSGPRRTDAGRPRVAERNPGWD